MSHTIADYERRVAELQVLHGEEILRHQKAIEGICYEKRIANEEIQRILMNLDSAIILHAEHIIYVRGNYQKAGEDRASCREGAIQQILKGGGTLFEEYYGTKNYDRWHGQGSNHPYWAGPSHGSIIFEIGLTKPVRARTEKTLTEEEINACIYYLRNLEKIQEANALAKAVA